MKNAPLWFVVMVAAIGIMFAGTALTGCSSSTSSVKVLRTEPVEIPKPEAKAVPPEVKREIPYKPDATRSEFKREVLPASVPKPAPKKKKKG